MSFEKVKYVYFIGIGGIGMSALAKYFQSLGKLVYGYDRSSSDLTEKLNQDGILVQYHDEISFLERQLGNWTSDNILVVHTPAVPTTHPHYLFFKQHGFEIVKRAKVLGEISMGIPTIAVAGTHGKTTTSTLLTHIFRDAGRDCIAFLGGVALNFDNNFIQGDGLMVVEADEYDRSFLTLFPESAIITSLDPDHLDIYGSYLEMQQSYLTFAKQINATGNLIVHQSIAGIIRKTRNCQTYSLTPGADFYAKNIQMNQGFYSFDFVTPTETWSNLSFSFPGLHNLENAIAASAQAYLHGIREWELKNALQSFKGVKRRFECHYSSNSVVYFDDYAHHPEELKACINSIRELYPNQVISGIFQPHLFSRTKDFALDFAKSLDLLDRCFLLDIYPARETPIPGIDSSLLLDLMNLPERKLIGADEVKQVIGNRPSGIWLTLGAGDIDHLVPIITQHLKNVVQG